MYINPFLHIMFQLNISIFINCVSQFIQYTAPRFTVSSILRGFINSLTLTVLYFSKVTNFKEKIPNQMKSVQNRRQ